MALLRLEPMTAGFLIAHALGSVSDAADGYLARRFNLQSAAGAIFDSLADALYIAVLLVVMIPYLTWTPWIVGWMVAILVVRLSAIGIGWRRFGELAFIHTYANKCTGALIVCVPFLLILFESVPILTAVCILATISAVEEFAIIATADELDRDVSSIFATAPTRGSGVLTD
ncbi:MAG: CDP-alcohol phosphatidyltransferase family protein [Thermomicrobiales bacterium]|nr:CDP-alcohol phosphatidyltransferase family protein [Thermomicrobiales bacterium]MCO5217951.1 CDP-alcohol phosphatidyltransferase family protein [Thermomicrobiales bacterium]MCO5224230.1 CDP-alcohol phosphatidyltransferase family protein [Thermomicrobiales bacterium]MCO5228891.1 CDP-alcohol phosphatidyltransferase family protein [Thermomicrobiales bacterium]